MIRQIIDSAKANPLLSFGWTIFTVCLGYLANHEVSFPDRTEYFEKANIEISVAKMEYDRVLTLLDNYRKAGQTIYLSAQDIMSFIDRKFPQVTDADIKHVRAALMEERRVLTKFLALLRNARFDNPSFVDMVRVLEDDAVYRDEFISKRIHFLDLIVSDFNKAKEIQPSLAFGIDEERRALEISGRENR